jgi:hypothetical protein
MHALDSNLAQGRFDARFCPVPTAAGELDGRRVPVNLSAYAYRRSLHT